MFATHALSPSTLRLLEIWHHKHPQQRPSKESMKGKAKAKAKAKANDNIEAEGSAKAKAKAKAKKVKAKGNPESKANGTRRKTVKAGEAVECGGSDDDFAGAKPKRKVHGANKSHHSQQICMETNMVALQSPIQN